MLPSQPGISLRALVLLVLASTLACDRNAPAPTPGDRAPEQVLPGERIAEHMTTDGDWLVSSELEAPLGATRVGVMLDMKPGFDPAPLEARAVFDDGSVGGWRPLVTVWRDAEEPSGSVANADLDIVAPAAQLRLRAHEATHILVLKWSAFVPASEHVVAAAPVGAVDTPGTVGLAAPAALQQGLLAGAKSRAQWNARANSCSSTHSINRASIHHTVTSRSLNGSYPARLRQIQSFHMDSRGYCDVGYHYLITEDGSAWEGRPDNRLGAHVGGGNTGNLGVSFVGCFHTSSCSGLGGAQPPQAMLNAAGALVKTASQTFGFTRNTTTVRGHRDNPGQSTACPGDNLHAQLGYIRTYNGGGTPTPAVGRALGTVWDLSITADAGQSEALGARLAGAVVKVTGGPETTVPADGVWSLDLAPGTYTLTASKAGYANATRQVTVTSGADAWASIGLTPNTTTGNARGTVWDLSVTSDVGQSAELGARLSGAVVRANTGQEVTVPGGEALWTLELPPGSYTLTASLDGYVSATKDVTITLATDSWASIGLSPEPAEEPEPVEPETPEPETPMPTEASVAIFVFDSDEGIDAPVSGALMKVGASVAQTGGDGTAEVAAPLGAAALEVVAEGYKPWRSDVEVTAAGLLLEVALERLPEIPQPEEEPTESIDVAGEPVDLGAQNQGGVQTQSAGGCASTALPRTTPAGLLALLFLALVGRRRR
jgi:hypothetical protein